MTSLFASYRRFAASVVRLGVLNINAASSKELPSDFPIEQFIVHEDYKTRSRDNDIAVIKMTREVVFSNPQVIRPACLYDNDKIIQKKVIATGWGLTEYAGSISDVLMKVNLDLQDLGKCVTYYEDEDFAIDEKKICAGVLAGGRDTCQGGECGYF